MDKTKYPRRVDLATFFSTLRGRYLSYLSLAGNVFTVASWMFKQPIIDWEYFYRLCDTFRSPHLWLRDGTEWRLREASWHPKHLSP